MNLNIQDLAAILVPLLTVLGFFWKAINKKSKEMESEFKEVRKEIKEVNTTLQGLERRLQRIEDRLEFSNKIVYVQHEEPKEN